MSKVLTFDLGTSYFKVCLWDESLRLLAHQRVAVPVERSAPGRCELPVLAFETCIATAVQNLARQVGGLSDVQRISFASQANSFTLLDSGNRPLGPFWLWVDQRALELEPVWKDFTATTDFYSKTGIAHFDQHFMLPKIEWLRQRNPRIVKSASHLCGISDYLVWWLTGSRMTEAGIAGLTGLVNVRNCQYWDAAVRFFNVPNQWLPQIAPAGADVGVIHSHFVDAWGLSSNCRLVMGCLDQYAGAIGAGITGSGQFCETTGTVLATVTCANEFATDATSGVFQGPSTSPGLFYRMMFSRVGAGLLEEYRNHFGEGLTFADLDVLAAAVAPGSDGLRLHPDSPDLGVDEMFVGRMPPHHRGHEVRAIMEAVAYELRAHVTALCGNEWPKMIRSVGGAARSRVWLQIKSEILGCPVEAVDCIETTSFGAARLAAQQLIMNDAGR